MKEPHIEFFEQPRNPLPGNVLFEALEPPEEIILAANPRLTRELIEGILRAAKETENIVILELSLTEMSLSGGYTGITPKIFAERVREAAENVGWFGYVLHADHVALRKGTDDEIENIKRELLARVEAGFTSFAIDAAHLIEKEGRTVDEKLRKNVEKSAELFRFLDENLGHRSYGREGEVGVIGGELTDIPEALYFVESLKRKGVDLHWLAISNGSKHGVSVDAEGNIVPQLTIDLKRTVEIVDALWAKGYRSRIAQHGISGTPLYLIAEKFPKGKINKGNVATYWMLMIWDILRIYEPELYRRIYRWVIDKYGEDDVPETETFTKYSKYAIKEFFHSLDKISDETKNVIREKAYAEALIHMKAFNMNKTAKKVYRYIREKNIKY
ncbi:MAG TPA: class II fructose-bisphosphate aldolase [Nitrososphaeria archaeon]|nr:class II fructose-bisphosphate aldolase [Nitrososphaeria archaeon]